MAAEKKSGPKRRSTRAQGYIPAPAYSADTRPHRLWLASEKQLAQKLREDINMAIESEKLVYTVDEVSKLLNVSRNLTYRLCRERKIPGVIFLGSRRMVISVAALNRLLEGNSEKPKGN